LSDTGIPESEFLDAINEVLSVQPFEEACEKIARLLQVRGQLSHFTLRPIPGHRLEHHPLPVLVGDNSRTIHALTDLVRLGRDLVTTRNLPGIKSKRRGLRNFDQYLSNLFEIEVFAELVRAGMPTKISTGTPDCTIELDGMTIGVEIRYKETPFPIALMSRVTPGFAFRDFGTFRVRLKSGAGGGGETINDLNAAILRDAEDLLQTSGGSVDRKFYMLEYDPNGEAFCT